MTQFDRRYQLWLRERYNLLLILSDPGFLFMLLPALLILAYFITTARARRRKAQWALVEQATDVAISHDQDDPDS